MSDIHHTAQALINYKTLSGVTRFEFDQLMLELSDYYRNKGFDQPFISISRGEAFDHSIGLSGEKVILQYEVGLSILNVNDNSAASAFGLEKADVLVKIKDKQITEENLSSLVESLTKLKAGGEFFLVSSLKCNKSNYSLKHSSGVL